MPHCVVNGLNAKNEPYGHLPHHNVNCKSPIAKKKENMKTRSSLTNHHQRKIKSSFHGLSVNLIG